MPIVSVEGIFMGANVKKSTFDGKEKSALYIDIYQPNSPDNEKTIQVKSDDLALIGDIKDSYQMGNPFNCKASINAYKNKAYFKLIDIG